MDIKNRRETGFWGKVKSLSVFKRVLLMCIAVPVAGISICLAIITKSFVLKIGLSLLCIAAGYTFWILLISFTSRKVFQIVLAIVLVSIPAAVIVNVFGDTSFLDRSYYRSNMEQLSSVTAPCGDYSAEAYQVAANEDGSFRGIVFLAYSPTGKMHMYQDTRRILYENNELTELDLQWRDDKTLLINGMEVEVFP